MLTCGGFMKQQQRIERLIEELKSVDPQVRGSASRKLVAIGKPALPALHDMLNYEDPGVREAVDSAYHAINDDA
jgi:HEAT repeat protein